MSLPSSTELHCLEFAMPSHTSRFTGCISALSWVSAPSGKAKEHGSLENGEHDEDDRFSEIPPITTRRSNSIRSDVSEFSSLQLMLLNYTH